MEPQAGHVWPYKFGNLKMAIAISIMCQLQCSIVMCQYQAECAKLFSKVVPGIPPIPSPCNAMVTYKLAIAITGMRR